jgi:hypothetical protein
MHELLRSMEAHQNRGSSRSSKFKGLHHHLLMIAAPAILCGAGLGLGLVQESETSFKLSVGVIICAASVITAIVYHSNILEPTVRRMILLSALFLAIPAVARQIFNPAQQVVLLDRIQSGLQDYIMNLSFVVASAALLSKNSLDREDSDLDTELGYPVRAGFPDNRIQTLVFETREMPGPKSIISHTSTSTGTSISLSPRCASPQPEKKEMLESILDAVRIF